MSDTRPPAEPQETALERLCQAVLDGRMLVSWQGPYFDEPTGWRIRIRPKGKR